MREQVKQIPSDLGTRLRALRERYPTLAITTEVIHHTDRLITFRATITIETLVRAQGHAAQPAEPTGTFVTAAEAMAVEQALLLGGFAHPNAEVHAAAGPEQASSPAARAAADRTSASSASPPETDTSAKEADVNTEPLKADVQVLPPSAPTSTADEANTASPEMSAAVTDTIPPVAPRPKRDRQAERARAKARATRATLPNDTADNSSVAATTSAPVDEVASAMLHDDAEKPATISADAPAPVEEVAPAEMAEQSPAPRRSRARSAATVPAAAATPATTVTAEAPTTREALRESWQVGRPIPAWWPQGRPLVSQPIGKTRVGRLRTLALDEEISTSLLDTYSTLLFGAAVAALDQTQSMILEERLNPAYPSPLEELRVRRILHPLAVSDEMAITEEQPFFIRWSDVPPLAEEPEPPVPPTITWRERGKKGGGRRR